MISKKKWPVKQKLRPIRILIHKKKKKHEGVKNSFSPTQHDNNDKNP